MIPVVAAAPLARCWQTSRRRTVDEFRDCGRLLVTFRTTALTLHPQLLCVSPGVIHSTCIKMPSSLKILYIRGSQSGAQGPPWVLERLQRRPFLLKCCIFPRNVPKFIKTFTRFVLIWTQIVVKITLFIYLCISGVCFLKTLFNRGPWSDLCPFKAPWRKQAWEPQAILSHKYQITHPDFTNLTSLLSGVILFLFEHRFPGVQQCCFHILPSFPLWIGSFSKVIFFVFPF